MAHTSEEKKINREDLLWVHLSEPSLKQKANSKGLSLYLVPIGCAVTAGVLATGLYNLYKNNSMKQQMCMRYRVLAQGVTIVIAIFGMLRTPK